MLDVFDYDQHTEHLMEVATEVLAPAYRDGALSEVIVTRARLAGVGIKRSTAQEISERLGIEVPEGVSLTMPDWLANQAADFLRTSFQQEYWVGVGETTRNDILATLIEGITDGLSIRKLADRILEKHGAAYTRGRASNVARTELFSALNAGHESGVRQLEKELGMPLGKEWVSALQAFTRPAHAALDGTVVATNENFVLNGVSIPYPGHHALDAADRCQCLCTIVSALSPELEEELME